MHVIKGHMPYDLVYSYTSNSVDNWQRGGIPNIAVPLASHELLIPHIELGVVNMEYERGTARRKSTSAMIFVDS